jgi:hypothetical protein
MRHYISECSRNDTVIDVSIVESTLLPSSIITDLYTQLENINLSVLSDFMHIDKTPPCWIVESARAKEDFSLMNQNSLLCNKLEKDLQDQFIDSDRKNEKKSEYAMHVKLLQNKIKSSSGIVLNNFLTF